MAASVSGAPAAGYRVSSTAAQPENVSVYGPAEDVRRLSSIETVPVDIEKSRDLIKRRVRLSNDGRPLSLAPDQVEVLITIEEAQAVRDYDGVEVRARDFKGTYQVAPQTAFLRLSGPKSVMDALQSLAEAVYVDLRGLAAGEHSVPLMVDLPDGVEIVAQKPLRFKVRILKPET